MNLSTLDRKELEAIVLDPPMFDTGQRCCEPGAKPTEPEPQRERRLRHVLEAAHELLMRTANRAIVGRCLLSSPQVVKEYVTVHFAGAEKESFVAVFVDMQLRVIAAETLFTGTLAQACVYPREVVRRAMHHNAASVVFAHNHPSGEAEPSQADEYLTSTLKSALLLIDVRVLDHIVVGGTGTVSFAERGLL